MPIPIMLSDHLSKICLTSRVKILFLRRVIATLLSKGRSSSRMQAPSLLTTKSATMRKRTRI